MCCKTLCCGDRQSQHIATADLIGYGKNFICRGGNALIGHLQQGELSVTTQTGPLEFGKYIKSPNCIPFARASTETVSKDNITSGTTREYS